MKGVTHSYTQFLEERSIDGRYTVQDSGQDTGDAVRGTLYYFMVFFACAMLFAI